MKGTQHQDWSGKCKPKSQRDITSHTLRQLLSKHQKDPGVEVHTYNPRIQEAKAVGSQAQKASLRYTWRSYFTGKKKKKRQRPVLERV
jgi:hypothetical protein